MATVLQAQTTSGFGQVGAVFEQPGRRGVSGGVNTRTVRGAETLGQKVTGAASSLSRGLAYPLDLSKKAGNAIENWSRFALTYDGLRKGLTAEEAAARTAKYLIDYQDLSIADKNIKGLIPFWTWTSRSFPLIVESMWMNPKAYAVYNSAVRNLTDKNAEYFAPDYLSSGGAFPLPFGQNLLGTPDFGFQRQEEGLAKFTDPSSFLGGLAPIIRAPIEAGMNQRFQTGGQVYNPYYEEGAGKQLQYLLQQIFPQIPAVGKIVNPVVGAIQNPLPSTLGTAGAVAGGKIAGPAGAAVGGALGLGAGALANQALGEKISPIQKGLEAVAAAPQNIPTTLQNLFAIGKPDYIEKEKGKFTPNESMVKVLQFLGLPITVLQDYQQVQAIKDIVTQLEQVTSRQKNKRK
jgi:hypothetical protein